MTTVRLVPLFGAGLAAATLACSAIGLAELSRASSPNRAPVVIVLDAAEDGQARQIIDSAKTPADYARAAHHAQRALAQSAYNSNARLRLVFIDTLEHGRLTKEGERLLVQSYDLAPYDATVAAWRVRFALEHWGDLQPTTRVSVRKEALALGGVSSRTADIRNTLRSVHDERGRVVAALWLRRLTIRPS